MRAEFLVGALALCLSPMVADASSPEAPGTAWTTAVGGIKDETAGDCLLRDDGLLLVCGTTLSYSTGDSDGLVVLLDPLSGEVEWERPYGGRQDEELLGLAPAPDGGYYAVGSVRTAGSGTDLWVLRCGADGELLWQRSYGGDLNDAAVSAAPTVDGGVVACGSTWSSGAGGSDGWAVMVNAEGEVEWARTYGGPEMERLFDVAALNGGFVATGTTYSEGSHGDVLTVWIDRQGLETARMVWGCPGYDYGRAVLPLPDGVAVACWSKRSACNVALLRADSTGSLLGHWVIPTGYNTRVETLLPAAGGFLAGGTAETGGGSDLEVFFWLVSPGGERVWELVRGGTGDEELASMVLAADGGPVLVGTTTSTEGGDADIWLLGLERLQEGVIADDG